MIFYIHENIGVDEWEIESSLNKVNAKCAKTNKNPPLVACLHKPTSVCKKMFLTNSDALLRTISTFELPCFVF